MTTQHTRDDCIRYVMGKYFCNDDVDYVTIFHQWKALDKGQIPENLDVWEPFEHYDFDSLFELVENEIDSLCEFVKAKGYL